MLTVTEKAAQYFVQVLESREGPSTHVLRIVAQGDGYELTLDEAQESDEVFQIEGRTYLLAAPEIAEALSRATIDVHQTAEGAPPRITLSTG